MTETDAPAGYAATTVADLIDALNAVGVDYHCFDLAATVAALATPHRMAAAEAGNLEDDDRFTVTDATRYEYLDMNARPTEPAPWLFELGLY